MVWQSFSRRLDALEQRAPAPAHPPRRDLSRWSDAEVEEMASYNERIVAANVSPDDAPALFTVAERERIAELLAKVEAA